MFHRCARKTQGAAYRMTGQSRTLSLGDCEREGWRNARPCFVLSTGRCGTLMLNRLLLSSPMAYAIHGPKPELIRASRRAFEEIHQHPEIFSETFKSAREEWVLDALVHDQVFIETNNRITFFAPIIREVFPRAVFIHLVRHPGDFVRSGIRRGYYSGEHGHDVGRITPKDGPIKQSWSSLSSIGKIGWLWNETNQFIEDFRQTVPVDDFLFVKAENLFSDLNVTKTIYEFLQLDGFDQKGLDNILSKPANIQRKGRFPKYADWDDSDKEELKAVALLSDKYAYFF